MEETTGRPEKQLETSEPSGSGPESTGRLAGAWPQRRSRLCPQTAVHPLITDGSELFWSKIFHPRRDTTDWQVVSGQIATAVHHGWKKKKSTPEVQIWDNLHKFSQSGCLRFLSVQSLHKVLSLVPPLPPQQHHPNTRLNSLECL